MSDLKASQVFAAYRQAVIERLQQSIAEFVPEYNAECNDIRVKYEQAESFAVDCPTDAAKAAITRLADAERKSRTMQLAWKKKQFLDSLKMDLHAEIKVMLDDLRADQHEETELNSVGKERKVIKAKFPDGSMAKVPQGLVIDFSQFQRV